MKKTWHTRKENVAATTEASVRVQTNVSLPGPAAPALDPTPPRPAPPPGGSGRLWILPASGRLSVSLVAFSSLLLCLRPFSCLPSLSNLFLPSQLLLFRKLLSTSSTGFPRSNCQRQLQGSFFFFQQPPKEVRLFHITFAARLRCTGTPSWGPTSEIRNDNVGNRFFE